MTILQQNMTVITLSAADAIFKRVELRGN